MTARHLLVFTLAALPAALAFADTVTMDNGDRLSGKLLHMSNASLTLQTSYAGKIDLPWSKIRHITTEKPVGVVLKGETKVRHATLLPGPAGRVVLGESQKPETAEVQLARIHYINPNPVESGNGVEYGGRVNFSGARVQGNSESSRANVDGEFKASAKTYRYGLRGSLNHSTEGGQLVTSNWLASGHYDRFVDAQRKRFVYGRSSVLRDEFQDIRLQTTLGGGYGWQIVEDGTTDFSVRGGLDAVSLKRYSGDNTSYPAFGWGVNFSRWMWNHRIQAFHDQDGYWNLSNSAQVTLRTRTGLRVPVAHGVVARTELDVDWTRRPPAGTKPTDSTLLLGAGYEW